MKKIKLFIATFAFTSQCIFAQEKVFYPDQQKVSSESYDVKISDIIALPKEIKFKLEFENTSNDIIVYDLSQSEIIANGNKYTPKSRIAFVTLSKPIVLAPHKKINRTVSVTAENIGSPKEFRFELKGVKKVILSDEKFSAQKFALPPSSNDFEAGSFTISLKDYKKSTGGSSVKLNAQYNGKKAGLIFPSKITVSMPDGKNYASADRDADLIILFPGDKEGFGAKWDRMPGGSINDMQKVEMNINFDDVFREGTVSDISGSSYSFTWDEELTKAKNK